MKTLLMLHGWGFSSTVFAPLKNSLQADFIIEAPDRPGYGDGNAASYADSPVAPLQSPSLVLGWSLGGLAAMRLALQQPELVSGLVLLAATPCFVNREDWKAGMDENVFEAFHQQVMDDQRSAMQQFVRLNSGAKIDRSSREVLAAHAGDAGREALLAGMEELADTDLRREVKNIKVPVLLLHAADDRVVPVKASHWLEEVMPAARLVEFPLGGHAFFLQQGREVATLIRSMSWI